MITRLCPKLSDWECVEAYQDNRQNGTPVEALAGRYGVTVEVMRRALHQVEKAARERGLPVPKRRKLGSSLSSVLSDAECLEMYRAHANGVDIEVLATGYRVSCSTVRLIFEKIEERGLACA
jgi:Mor family transcriptional regulator